MLGPAIPLAHLLAGLSHDAEEGFGGERLGQKLDVPKLRLHGRLAKTGCRQDDDRDLLQVGGGDRITLSLEQIAQG
jgi:hypothetical protein